MNDILWFAVAMFALWMLADIAIQLRALAREHRNGSDIVEADVSRIAFTQLAPDDVIVLSAARDDIDDETVKRLKEDMERMFQGHRCMVLGGGLKMSLLHPGVKPNDFCNSPAPAAQPE